MIIILKITNIPGKTAALIYNGFTFVLIVFNSHFILHPRVNYNVLTIY